MNLGVLSRFCLLAGIAGLATSAAAQPTITLFGKTYGVQRFDYANSVLLPNIPFPMDPPIPFIESEGTHWLGSNQLIMTADDINDIAPLSADNWVIVVDVLTSGSTITGLRYNRTIRAVDTATAGYDLNPTGVTRNTSTSGTGANGNVIVAFGDGAFYAFDLASGAQLPAPSTASCLGTPATCRLDISARNINLEDVAFVPGAGARPDAFYAINQDFNVVERWGTEGAFISEFAIGAFPGGTLFAPKGMTYSRDSARLPEALRHPEGVVIVAFDDNYPALQAFRPDGTLIATEVLTTDGTPTGPARLDIAGCPRRLQLESLAIDPDTGRLFLTNQGSQTTCGYMFILTPVCRVDLNNDTEVDFSDIEAFIALYNANDLRADFNGDGEIDFSDIERFIAEYNAGC